MDEGVVMSDKTLRLSDPFPEKDIQWRAQQVGIGTKGPWAMVLAYVDARAVQDRLDAVVGPPNWQTRFSVVDGGVFCELSIRSGDGWVTKMDGSPETQVEAFKGGISKALVRTASQWGIGRYLYHLPSTFAPETRTDRPEFKEKHLWHQAKTKDGKTFYWKPPSLPDSALPKK